MKILIAVCGRAGARFFTSAGSTDSLKMVAELPHPHGKLQAHGIDADKGGAAGSSAHRGQNTFGSASGAVVHEAEHFAGEVAAWLENARTDHKYERYIIVADAKFTGELREKMTKHVADLVHNFVGKDLQKATEAELITHLKDVLAH